MGQPFPIQVAGNDGPNDLWWLVVEPGSLDDNCRVELIRLLQDGPSPFAATLVFLRERCGYEASVQQFAAGVLELIDAEVVRLINVDPRSGDATEYWDVPGNIVDDLERITTLPGDHDPWGYELRLGVKAPRFGDPGWSFDLNRAEMRFSLTAPTSGEAEDLLVKVRGLFTLHQLEVRTRGPVNDGYEITGELPPQRNTDDATSR
jgi:hypothetical protein